MQAQEQQLIDQLFQKLNEVATQGGPRDPQAEAYINQHVERIPGAAYYMAQAIIVQRQALKQAEAQLNQLQQQRGGPTPQQQPQQAQSQQSGGFLAGAAQTALGIGGGILIANAGMALADDLFGDSFDEVDLSDAYDEGYEEAAGDMLDDAGGLDDLGDFDVGGFDDFDF
jgi:hypothetical protein